MAWNHTNCFYQKAGLLREEDYQKQNFKQYLSKKAPQNSKGNYEVRSNYEAIKLLYKNWIALPLLATFEKKSNVNHNLP